MTSAAILPIGFIVIISLFVILSSLVGWVLTGNPLVGIMGLALVISAMIVVWIGVTMWKRVGESVS